MEEGYNMGKKKGVEDGKEDCKKSLLEGHKLMGRIRNNGNGSWRDTVLGSA